MNGKGLVVTVVQYHRSASPGRSTVPPVWLADHATEVTTVRSVWVYLRDLVALLLFSYSLCVPEMALAFSFGYIGIRRHPPEARARSIFVHRVRLHTHCIVHRTEVMLESLQLVPNKRPRPF